MDVQFYTGIFGILWMASGLSAVSPVFIHEVAVFEHSNLKGIHEDPCLLDLEMLLRLEGNCNCSVPWRRKKNASKWRRGGEKWKKNGNSVSCTLII